MHSPAQIACNTFDQYNKFNRYNKYNKYNPPAAECNTM
jgi:hypothetical protein